MTRPPSPKWTHALALFALVFSAACSPLPTMPEATPLAPTADTPHPPEPARPAAPSRTVLRARLANRRAEQIAHLHAYGEKRQFPLNVTNAPNFHMFCDPKGHLCAVANLLETDGRHDLVEATARENNALAVADVHGGPIMDWILASGLTQEELVRVQVWPVLPEPEARKLARKPATAEERMNAAVAKHVVKMEAELKANTEASLVIAVERYLAAYPDGT
jgi:hypothetical protein